MSCRKTLEEFIAKAVEIHGNKYDYSLTKYTGNKNKVEIVCQDHGVFLQKPNTHLNPTNIHGCPKCGRNYRANKRKKPINILLSQLRKLYPQLSFPGINQYTNNKGKFKAVCIKHGEFYKSANALLKGAGCPSCGRLASASKLSLTIDDFIKRSCKKHKGKYSYHSTVYKNIETTVNIICPIHGVFKQTARNHLKGAGCKKCAVEKEGLRKRKRASKKIIADFKKAHNKKYDYSFVKYYNSSTPVDIVCHKHGHFLQRPSQHRKGAGCPVCRQSKGEESIFKELNKGRVKFVRNKRFPDCRDKHPLSFDFFIPSMNICIEYDGELHYKKYSNSFKGSYKFELTKKHDNIKTEYCKNKNIVLIRIPYWRKSQIEKIISNLLIEKSKIEIQKKNT